MPLLQITTNIGIDDISETSKTASKITATMLGKPESYMMVSINANATIMFAGTDAPCAHLQLSSLGLDENKTAVYSAALCQFITENLGIESSRIYIAFSNPDRHMWGWDNKTF